jgi:PAS domain S-box-containing protein
MQRKHNLPDMYRILYVDDEPNLLEIGKLFLEESGQFNVDISPSASAGLALLASADYDAVISDYQMPGMDGIKFLKMIRRSGNTIPFILFTGRGREEVVIQALNDGADFYLQKGGEPVSQFTELAHKIRQSVQKRQAEIMVRDHEQREADIINFLPDATFAIDIQGKVIAWNRAIEEMTGIPAMEMLYRGDYQYSLPFYGERRPVIIDLVLNPDEITVGKYPFIKKEGDKLISEIFIPHFHDGRGAYLWFTASPLYNSQGKISGAIEAIRDITNLKQVEADLRGSEVRYRHVVEDQTELICRFLPDGTHVFVNEAYCRYFGINRENIIGSRFRPRIHPEDRENVARLMATLTTEQPIITIDQRIIMADGSTRWQRWVDRAIFDADGSLKEYQSVGRDITDWKRSEEAQRESENQLRTIMENIPDCIVRFDTRCRHIYVNPAVVNAFGQPPGFFLGKTLLDLPPVDNLENIHALHDAIGEVIRTGLPNGMETRWKTHDGWRSYEVLHIPEKDRAGNIISVLAITHDITERKRADEILRESRQVLEVIFDTIPVRVFWKDINLNFLGCNTAFARDAGFEKPEDVVGKDDYMMGWRNQAGLYRADDLLVIESGNAKLLIEEPQTTPSGEQITLLTSKVPLINTTGKIIGVLGIYLDITERKHAEKALKESEEKFREIFNNISDGIELREMKDDSLPGKYLEVNDVACRMLGYTREELVQHSPPDFILTYLSRPVEEIRRDLLTTGHSRFEVGHRNRNGEIIPVEINAHAIVLYGKTMVLSVVRDITERKLAEDALREANKKLNILSGITRHDINNQLLTARGFLKLLHKKIPDPAYEKDFTRVEEAWGRIYSLIRFTRHYEQIGVSAPVWQDCRILADTAIKDISPCNVLVKNDLPAHVEVFADPLIVRVFFNLVDNAFRYGGPKMTMIRFSAQGSADCCCIICEDDGDGVPAEEKELIFERGFGKNTGMGLFLSAEILAISGITIKETGEPGKGARFEIRMPKGTWRLIPRK